MKTGLYPRLAWTGIKKNRKIYLPYLLTCTGMVMMFYIIVFLSQNPAVKDMPGGSMLQMILSFGTGVIGMFALIFLFYTHSFLIRRRKKEFGLYNILGMGKWNLARILVWESLMMAVISLSGGLLCGILFSKAAELCMAHMLGGNISFSFWVKPEIVGYTLLLFTVIFLLILLNTLRQIHVSKPVELLNGEMVGEKPPRANWIVAIIGVVILAAAYYIAVTIENSITALIWFFVASLMVVIATYLLFIAGSVVLCKLLQKRKGYYYKANHFISVSSMAYRMKRNGAGLASICILSTIVLVMISSTSGLFIGSEDILRDRYPRNIAVDTDSIDPSHTHAIHRLVNEVLDKNNVQAENIIHYRYLGVSGYCEGDQIFFDQSKLSSFQAYSSGDVRMVYFIPLEDYNQMEGTQKVLLNNEILIYTSKINYTYDSVAVEGCPKTQVKEVLSEFEGSHVSAAITYPSLFIIVPDMEDMEMFFEMQAKAYGDHKSFMHDYYGFDLNCNDEKQVAVYKQISDGVQQLQKNDSNFPVVANESVANERSEFYALYGGLFFLGILLGIVFIFAAVLIMYYKQISEGYEDQSRFEIMQKIGMTKKEIRKSINSQVLTVFFLPLLAAGVHIAFSFPMISKMLLLFNLTDTGLLIAVMAGCYLIFALFYVLVYRITSGAYYRIVSGKESNR